MSQQAKIIGTGSYLPERILTNHDLIHKYGNTSASSIGIALDELYRTNKLSPGKNILLTAFGFGLTWGACLLTYEEDESIQQRKP